MLALLTHVNAFAGNASVKTTNATVLQHSLSAAFKHVNLSASFVHQAELVQKGKQTDLSASKTNVTVPQHSLSASFKHVNLSAHYVHKAEFDKKVKLAAQPGFSPAPKETFGAAPLKGEVCEFNAYGYCDTLCSAAQEYRSCLATYGCAADPASYVQNNCQGTQVCASGSTPPRHHGPLESRVHLLALPPPSPHSPHYRAHSCSDVRRRSLTTSLARAPSIVRICAPAAAAAAAAAPTMGCPRGRSWQSSCRLSPPSPS